MDVNCYGVYDTARLVNECNNCNHNGIYPSPN